MSPAELTLFLGVIVAAATGVLVPIYLDRRRDRREEKRLEEKRKADLAEDAEVNWEAINRAIVKERDRLQAHLNEQAAKHSAEMDALREHHTAELEELRRSMERDADDMRARLDEERAELKQRYDQEINQLRARLADAMQKLLECQETVRQLHGELYELQKRLPPAQR